MSIEKQILNFIAERQVISTEELVTKLKGTEKHTLMAMIGVLKEKGLICSSNLLSPTTLVITSKGRNSI
ncbi:MAG: hypothetical protein DRP06_02885 [Candidatus Aenigmatarchaeota archaeon]|nr:MAG: hypothetical protein DRP06_02885 [Candidatus Aenigmarchaeota archaeon]